MSTPPQKPDPSVLEDSPTEVLAAAPMSLAPGAQASAPGRSSLLQPGQVVAERYTVLEPLGQGGMGVVVAAYDAKLDRRVALKLIKPGQEGPRSEQLQVRLEREARAMARLNHPNVVALYDAGWLEGGAQYLAMEYVAGETLKAWQRQQRPWREVLRVYVQAGRGLEAAHRAGLVHRDFKPENVLVGRSGGVKVTDFGVARAQALPTPTAPLELPQAEQWQSPLTLQGMVVGTPRYLAPEVLCGQPADERSDVFAFCMALYEALYGQPAFEGEGSGGRMGAQLEGRYMPPGRTEVAGWVERALRRGLSQAPEQRPRLGELLAVLEDAPEERLRGRVLTGALVAGVGALAVLAAWAWSLQQGPGCGGQEQQLAGVWDEVVRGRVRQALVGTELAYAPDTAQRVVAALERYAGEWAQQSQRVCEQAGQVGQKLQVRREACLQRRRSALRALTELLGRGPDAELVPRATQAVLSLPPLAYCADDKALLAAVPPPEEPFLRGRVEALQQQLDRLAALYQAGKYKQGVELGARVLEQLGDVDWAPLRAQALVTVARLRASAGEYEGAEVLLRQALPLAARAQDTRLLAQAWSLLVFVIGDRQGRHQQALGLELVLKVAALRAGDTESWADALLIMGSVLQAMGRAEEALTRQQQALTLLEQALGPEHPALAHSLNNLANALNKLGRQQQALAYHERALALRERALGPEHPDVAQSLSNLGNVLRVLGRHEQALASHERALALRRKVLGPEHPFVAQSLNNLGNLLAQMGRYEQALARYEQAVALTERLHGPESMDLARSLLNQGVLLHEMGRYAQARTVHERALAIWRKPPGPPHPSMAFSLEALGRTLVKLRQFPQAEQYLQRALEMRKQALGPNHPLLADTLLVLGDLRLAQGRAAQAVPLLERSLALIQGDEAEVKLSLAQALWDTGQDRRRAVALASEAREWWGRLGHPKQADVEQWLATHALP